MKTVAEGRTVAEEIVEMRRRGHTIELLKTASGIVYGFSWRGDVSYDLDLIPHGPERVQALYTISTRFPETTYPAHFDSECGVPGCRGERCAK